MTVTRLMAFIALVLALLLGVPSTAQVFMPPQSGMPQSYVSQGNGNIASLTTSTTLTFAHPITKLLIWTAPSSSTIYVNLQGGTADTTCAPIFGGSALSFPFNTPVSQVTIYAGASASGTYGYAGN